MNKLEGLKTPAFRNQKPLGAVIFGVFVFIYGVFAQLSPAQADIPNYINYQARLRDNSGNAITASTTIQFTIYNHISNGLPSDAASASGPLLWKETLNQSSGSCAQVDPDTDGYFALNLGSCVSFPSYLDFSTGTYYLAVKIGSDAEASPRVILATHPYAFNSHRVDGFHATSTATAGQILALGNDLSFNIGTGTYFGGNISLASTTATSTFSGNLSVTGNASFATTTIANLVISGATNFNDITWLSATGTDLYLSNNLSVLGDSFFGTIASGTWQGSVIQPAYGGTGQDSSGWTGFAYLSGGVWSATNTISAGALPGTVMLEGENISLLNNDLGYITTSSIASSTFWDQAYGWGDHSLAGYLTTTPSETDPFFMSASSSFALVLHTHNSSSVSGLDVSNFATNTLSQWYNDVGYITSSALSVYLTYVSTTLRFSGDGAATPIDLAQQGASVGEVLKWNGTYWAPDTDLLGSSSTSYTAGDGLTLVGTEFRIRADSSFTTSSGILSLATTSISQWVNDSGYVTSGYAFLPSGSIGQILVNAGGTSWVPTSSLFVAGDGFVGIGVTAPENILHVNGGISLSDVAPSTTAQALYNDGGDLYWNGSMVALDDTLDLNTAYHNGASINTDSGPIYLSGMDGLNGAISVYNVSSTGEIIYVNNLASGNSVSVRNMSVGSAFYARNQGSGNGLRVDNNTDTGTGVYLDNNRNGTGISLTNSSGGTGFSLTNSGSNFGINLAQSGLGTGMYIRANNGIGFQVDLNTTTQGIYVDNRNTGSGIYVMNETDGKAIYVQDQGNKTSVMIEKTALAGGNLLELSNAGNGRPIYITTTGTYEGLWMRNAGTGASLWIEDSSSDVTPFVLDASGRLGIGKSSPSYPLDVIGDINATGTYRMNGFDYGQYFIDSSGTSGQVWQSDGLGRGVWTNTSTLGFASSTHSHISADLPLDIIYQSDNISFLYNDAAYITSSALVGFITDGNTNWDNIYGFITSSSAENLTNKTGDISMWTNNVGYVTSGYSFSNLNFSNATGTNLYLSNGLTVLGPSYFGTIASGTWNGSVIGAAYGGTGTSTLGSAGTVAYSNGTSYAFTTVGTAGQLLQSNASGAPTWISTTSLGFASSAHTHTSTTISGLTAANFATSTISQWVNDAGYITSSALSSYLTIVSTTARLIGNGTNASPLDIAQQGAISGQVLKWNGSSWAPANDDGGASSTVYTAGDGLSLVGTEFRLRINSTLNTSTGILGLATTSVTAAAYGTASSVPQFTVDAYGRLTAASNLAIQISTSAVSGLGTMATQNANAVAITGGTINGTSIGVTTPSTAIFTNATSSNLFATTGTFTNLVVTNPSSFANLTFSNATGTNLYLSNSLTVLGPSYFGTIASGTWNGSVIGAAYGGTGTSTLGSAGTMAYSNGISYAFTTVGTAGQLLQSNGSGAPTWISTTSLGFASSTHTHATLSQGTGIQTFSYNGSSVATVALATTSVTAAAYGTASSVPQFTVDAYGRLTAASNLAIQISTSAVSGLGTMATQNANAVAITGGTINGTSIGATTPSTAIFTNATSSNLFATTGTFTNLVVNNFNPTNLAWSNATGTNLYLSNGLTVLGPSYFGTIASGTWNGSVIGTAYGGTGTSTLGSAGRVAYSNGTSLAYTATGTVGWLLQANGTGAPTWVSTSSLGISAGAAGSTGQIQFNNGGALAASTALYWDNTNGRLGINTSTPYDVLAIVGRGSAPIFETYTSSGISKVLVSSTGDFYLRNNAGFFQSNFTNCTGTSAKVIYDATTGQFGCGTDAGVGYISGLGNGKYASSSRIGPLPATGFETSTVSVTVTPSSTGNLFWINVSAVPVGSESQGTDSEYIIRRGSCTTTAKAVSLPKTIATKAALQTDAFSVSYVDNPATTSPVTYHLCGRLTVNLTRTVYVSSSEMVVQAIMLGADLAEVYYSNDSEMYPGSVVSIDPSIDGGVKRSGRAYDNNAIGIITTKPGMVLAELGKGTPVMVALSGRVPVKVTAANGAINPGDYLTASAIPGVAMKATKAGTVIGQALTSFDGSGTGEVVVFIKNTSYNGTLSSASTTATDSGKDILSRISFETSADSSASSSVMVLDRLVSGLDVTAPLVSANKISVETIDGLSGDINIALRDDGKLIFTDANSSSTIQPAIVFDRFGNGIFSGKITARELQVERIQAIDDLNIKVDQADAQNMSLITDTASALNLSLSETKAMLDGLNNRVGALENQAVSVDSQIIALQASLSGLEMSFANIPSSSEKASDIRDAFGANVLVVNDAAVFGGTLSVKKHTTFGEDTVGQAMILAGQESTAVSFAEPYETLPIVVATPVDFDGKWKLVDMATSGFKIKITDMQMTNTVFNWQAFGTSADSKTFVSDGTTQPVGLVVLYAPAVVPENPATEPESVTIDTPVEDPQTETTPAAEITPEPVEPPAASEPTISEDNLVEPSAEPTAGDTPSTPSPDGVDGVAPAGDTAAADSGTGDGPSV